MREDAVTPPGGMAAAGQIGGLIGWCRRVAGNPGFQNFILAVIVVNAVLVGLETSEEMILRFEELFAWINALIQAIFVVEIAVRLLACWPRLGRFFTNGWNVFDFAIVAISLLPLGGNFATVARLARLMRVTRLISVFPDLRLIVGTMLRSVRSMGPVALLLGLVLYIYAVLGYHLFGEHDPEHWGGLGTALQTLFQILTLEGWIEVQSASAAAGPLVWIFFASFILIAVFVVVNLFIAVVLNNLETVKAEERQAEAEASYQGDLLQRIEEMKANLEVVEQALRKQTRV